MDRRTFLALVLSMLVFFAYSAFMRKYYPQPLPQVNPAARSTTQGVKSNGESSKATSHDAFLPSEAIQENEQELSNTRLVVKIGLQSASIREIELKLKANGKDKSEPLVHNPQGDGLFTLFDLDKGLRPRTYNLERASSQELVFSRTTDQQLNLRQTYRLQEDVNYLQFDLEVFNPSTEAKNVKCRLLSGRGLVSEAQWDKRLQEVAYSSEEKATVLRSINKPKQVQTNQLSWFALRNQYFSLILKPLEPVSGLFIRPGQAGGAVETGVELDFGKIPANTTLKRSFVLYAGPNDYPILKEAKFGWEESLYGGFFGMISYWLFSALQLFYQFFKNWGLSIIGLSLLISLILFPLNWRSLKSMRQMQHKMQEIQPALAKLQEEYKNNPQKLNRETWELYKRQGINPLQQLGGCLPMFLQIPIFFALYQTILRAWQLRGATFLWVKDLSRPDTFIIPQLHLLPLLMILAMFWQQKMSQGQSAQTAQTKQMGIFMVVIFGVLFYNFSAGLILYWFTNTLAMTLLQIPVNWASKAGQA